MANAVPLGGRAARLFLIIVAALLVPGAAHAGGASAKGGKTAKRNKSAKGANSPKDPRPAHPDTDKEMIGILHVATEGVSSAAGAKFEESVADGLGLVGYKVAKTRPIRDYLARSDYTEGCFFGPCLREVFITTRIRLVLVARIQGEGTSYSYVISLLDTRTGELTAQISSDCVPCTTDEAIGTATTATIALVRGDAGAGAEVADPLAGPTGAIDLEARDEPPTDLSMRIERGRSRVGATGWVLLGAAVIAGTAGGYFISAERDDLAYPALGVSGAFALSGIATVVISRKF